MRLSGAKLRRSAVSRNRTPRLSGSSIAKSKRARIKRTCRLVPPCKRRQLKQQVKHRGHRQCKPQLFPVGGGAAGAAGLAGAAGAAGRDGAVGSAGLMGPAGVGGTSGTVGAAGPAGVQGPAGAPGAAGAAGPAGVQGPAGPTGPSGTGGDRDYSELIALLTQLYPESSSH
ncbi:Collagen triple helix repeat protein [Paenibacillus curdlanolyticus YK9]|uniref:Collagen triple helix repeat protein n=1 Tax=Paenibacillus curdlanolyticus YK9 TaxID=717606 RepID=E0I6R3_9BACL|nr:hypothetical protein [Paenibacillus curdlanolyticus]EFM11729.1 Collagen triple helix repeat protein [Paenibacillus curdlanolyticus YK9]